MGFGVIESPEGVQCIGLKDSKSSDALDLIDAPMPRLREAEKLAQLIQGWLCFAPQPLTMKQLSTGVVDD